MYSRLRLSFSLLACLGLISVSPVWGLDLETDEQKYSYAVGIQIGTQLMNQFSPEESGVDVQALLAGIRDVIHDHERLLTEEDITRVIEERQLAMQAQAQARAVAAAQAGAEWRTENRNQAGVTETASGLQYSVIHSAEETSSDSPGINDTVVVHYRGTFIDGREFDSSIARGVPVRFSLNGIIPGWQEALQLMRTGDKWNVVIPPELAYGESGSGSIGPNETLIFEIELLEVKRGSE